MQRGPRPIQVTGVIVKDPRGGSPVKIWEGAQTPVTPKSDSGVCRHIRLHRWRGREWASSQGARGGTSAGMQQVEELGYFRVRLTFPA